MAQCRATKRDGSRCTQTVAAANGLCWAHDPANADKRRRMASRAGSREISGLKKQIKDLAEGVLSGDSHPRRCHRGESDPQYQSAPHRA